MEPSITPRPLTTKPASHNFAIDYQKATTFQNLANAQKSLLTPNQDFILQPSTQDSSIQFAQIKSLSIDIPVNPQEKIDIYLDIG